MNHNWVLIESYLNHLTDGGRKFFSKFLTEAWEMELYDGLRIVFPADQIDFQFHYDPLRKCWMASSDGLEPMNVLMFCSLIQTCSFAESFEFIRGLFFPSQTGNSNGWPIAIQLARQRVSTHDEIIAFYTKDIPEENLRKIRKQQKRDWELYEKSLHSNEQKYETTPEEVLLFYFRPGKKEDGFFCRASDVVNFMKDQHPGFWKLSEEETGRLLNSEGFAICKGRQNGVRGYFLKYRDDFKQGVCLELKLAS